MFNNKKLHAEHVNEGNVCDANDPDGVDSNNAKVDCPIVSNELTNSIENNALQNEPSLNAIPNKNTSTHPTSANSSISIEQTKIVGQKMCYGMQYVILPLKIKNNKL